MQPSHAPKRPRNALCLAAALAAASLACNLGSGNLPPLPTIVPSNTPAAPAVTSPAATGAPVEAATAAPVEAATEAPSAGGSCANQYLPVVQGATWTRQTTVTAGQVTTTATITDVQGDSFTVERVLELSTGDQTWTEAWKCTAEGLSQFPSNGELSITGQDASGVVTVKTTSQTGVTIPASIQPGDSWTQDSAFEVTRSGGAVEADTLHYEFQAVALEPVNVPAGLFNAMRLQLHLAWTTPNGSSSSDMTEWFAQDVGLVQWMISATSHSELISYNIP